MFKLLSFFVKIYGIYVTSRLILAYSWDVPPKGKEKWILSKRHQHVHPISFSKLQIHALSTCPVLGI
jgi:hypothetical protein